MAQIDNNQFVVDKIIAYRGEPWTRTTMSFEVLFADGTLIWLPFSQDLFTTIQFGDFVASKRSLFPLRFSAELAMQERTRINTLPITAVEPGDTVLVDLRSYGATWYQQLDLPDSDHLDYMLEFTYTGWKSRNKRTIKAVCTILDETYYSLDHCFVHQYGSYVVKRDHLNNIASQLPANVRLVDKQLLIKYPNIIAEDRRHRLITHYTN